MARLGFDLRQFEMRTSFLKMSIKPRNKSMLYFFFSLLLFYFILIFIPYPQLSHRLCLYTGKSCPLVLCRWAVDLVFSRPFLSLFLPAFVLWEWGPNFSNRKHASLLCVCYALQCVKMCFLYLTAKLWCGNITKSLIMIKCQVNGLNFLGQLTFDFPSFVHP